MDHMQGNQLELKQNGVLWEKTSPVKISVSLADWSLRHSFSGKILSKFYFQWVSARVGNNSSSEP